MVRQEGFRKGRSHPSCQKCLLLSPSPTLAARLSSDSPSCLLSAFDSHCFAGPKQLAGSRPVLFYVGLACFTG